MTAATLAGSRPARWVVDQPSSTLAARLSLIVVIFNAREWPIVFVAVAAVAVLGLRHERLATHPALWFALAAVLGAVQVTGWEGVDNHVITTTYWCLALGLSLAAVDPEDAVGENARALIGLVFLFATFWKLVSGQFLNGEFFRYTLLFDDRFSHVASLAGLTDAVHQHNLGVLLELRRSGTGGALMVPAALSTLATVMTVFGVVLEGLVAATHLARLPARAEWTRHATLLLFAAATYLVVPVGGFGALLMVLGAARCRPGDPMRLVYVGGIVAISLYTPVWRALFG